MIKTSVSIFENGELSGDTSSNYLFQPWTALVQDGGEVPYPSCTKDFQYEVELVLAIGRGGADIAET